MSDKLLIVEFNELCEDLLVKWIAAGHLPNFRALRAKSDCYLTIADNQNDDELEPWIQWYSLHSGRPFSQHQVFSLTDGHRAQYEDLWTLSLQAGRSAMCFGSMNVKPFKGERAVYLGDPWVDETLNWPIELNKYAEFISPLVRDHTNERPGHKLSSAIVFMRFMLSHGLRAKTIGAAIAQIISERLKTELKYRRVAILDRLQFDLFANTYARTKPDVATFFSNSTAHLQHGFWKHMSPESFDFPVPEAERKTYGDAILYGYKQMDRMLGDLMLLAKQNNARVVFCTALSQQPAPATVVDPDKSFYRFSDLQQFLRDCDIEVEDASPIMAHQVALNFSSDSKRKETIEKLKAFKTESGPFFYVGEHENRSVVFHCVLARPTTGQRFWSHSGKQFVFADYFYKLPTTKNGRHHPQGSLWVESNNPKNVSEKMPITDVLPMLLKMIGISQPKGASIIETPDTVQA